MHVWRINSDAAYSTFPTKAEFEGNTKKIANTAADGAYANAVWVDIDLACGQCHGGSAGASAVKNGAPYWSKASLAVWAKAMHTPKPSPDPIPPVVPAGAFTKDGFVATYVGNSSGGSGNLTALKVTWGDGKTSIVNDIASGATATVTHVYTRARTFTAKATVFDLLGTQKKVSSTITASLTVAPLSISGTVRDNAGNALRNVVVTLKQGTIARKRTVTRVDGSYLLNNVLPNIATGATTSTMPYTLVPTKKNMTFPAGGTFTVTNAPVSAATITAN
jgi:hypothetical protein